MRIIFCDDDPMVIEQLLSYVSEFFAQLGGKKVEFAYADNRTVYAENGTGFRAVCVRSL